MDFMSELSNSIFNNLYIGLLVIAYCYAFCKPQLEYLFKHVNDLDRKQDILHQSMLKLKTIIDIDSSLSKEQTEQLNKIKKEIRSIKSIVNNDSDYSKDSNSQEDQNDNQDQEELSDSNSSPKNKPVLPVQNHITFPRFFIFNEKNFKQTKLSDNDYEFHFIGKDLRLISNELAKFLKFKTGTCMEFDDAYELVFNYIEENDIVNIGEDNKLSKLFGVNENEDYEYSAPVLVKYLKTILEPHFKKIAYEYY